MGDGINLLLLIGMPLSVSSGFDEVCTYEEEIDRQRYR